MYTYYIMINVYFYKIHIVNKCGGSYKRNFGHQLIQLIDSSLLLNRIDDITNADIIFTISDFINDSCNVLTFGVILSASYMLMLYKKVFLGQLSENLDKKNEDVNLYEICVYTILVLIIFVIGIKPGLILSYTTSSLERIIQLYPISIF